MRSHGTNPAVVCQAHGASAMEPPLAKRGATAQPVAGSPTLLSLPDPVLAQIAHYSRPEDRLQLLAVCRGTRDAVLSGLQRCSLTLQSSDRITPAARMLDRACSMAARLHVCITFRGMHPRLQQLLRLGIDRKWTHAWQVHALTVKDEARKVENIHIVPLAFPDLRQLHLENVSLDDGRLFSSSLAPAHLHSLTLDSCWINYIAQQAAAAAIAALPALKALTLAGSTDLKLAQHVTSLTSLSFSKLHRRVLERDIQQLIAAAARNPGLLCFSVDRAKRAEGDNEGEEDEFFLPDKALELLLTSCPSLQHLDLSVYSLDAEELDVLLEYGTDITYLAVFDIAVAASRAQAPCNIRSLAITNQWHPDIQQLAYLPLKQAISLQFDDDMGTFWAPLGPEALSTDQVPPRLRQAAINLTSCPAWRAAQPSTISLQATHDEAVIGLLSPAYAAQLLEALAPLGSATLVTSFELEFSAHWLPLGSEAVGALRSSLGDGIEALELGNCDLAADFWAALSQHLPNLATLHFKNLCNFQMHDLVMYLMRRPADKPLALTLPTNHYLRVTAENLLASLQLWGVQNVQIIHGHT